MKILVLGATGMLGHVVLREFAAHDRFIVTGTMRDPAGLRHFPERMHGSLVCDMDVLDRDALPGLLERVRPDLVVNCVGLVKQLAAAKDPSVALPINAHLPHRLASLCAETESRMIHISTDCVFSGRKGGYREEDPSDAEDLYGRSKHQGEVTDQPHVVTLRTSIIGHELNGSVALVDWFLSQAGPVKGYAKAIFSGFPTVELARIIREYVAPNLSLHGLYHVSAVPIDKLSLLRMVAEVYGHHIVIQPDEAVCIDRSLDSTRFRAVTGYRPPEWPELIRRMHAAR